jgi:ankyrin repeat protein
MRRLTGIAVAFLLAPFVVGAAPQDLRLVEAAKRNDPKAAAALLKPGVPGMNVNTTQPDGATALHWASHWNDLATADLLIRAGANVNAEDTTGVTPLILACLNGSRAMVDRLVAAGAQPNAGRPSAVMMAARTGNADVMQILLTHGGDANAKESDRGQTALMWAASEMHPGVLRVLIEHGANVQARTVGAAPAAMGAPGAGRAGGRGTAYGAGRGTAGDGAPRVETAAPSPTDSDASDALTGRDAGAAAALGGGRGRGSTNGANGFSALLFAARVGDLESVRLLLNAGANPNDTADDGMSALVMATVRGFPAVATVLLDKGADPNRDGAGFTAMHWAAGSWETELTVTSITPNREGEWSTIAGLKEGRLDLIKALLAHGANPNARMKRSPARAGSSKNPGLTELEGATPFLLAAVAGATDVMRTLVAAGADVHIGTTGKGTPLMAAAGLGRVSGEVLVPESQTLAAARLVLEMSGPAGVDVNAVDVVGNTALHYAAYMRRDSIVELLAGAGANLEVKNKFGETPLFLSEVVIQFAGGGTFQMVPSKAGDLLRKLGAKTIPPPYQLRPRFWPDLPHT